MMTKGLIILETEGCFTEDEFKEVKRVMSPLFDKYKIALLSGKDALSCASSDEREEQRQRAINLINQFWGI